jgi:hypothetical protein
MKKHKLSLSGLTVMSFTTSANEKIKGGATRFCDAPTLYCEQSARYSECVNNQTMCIVR